MNILDVLGLVLIFAITGYIGYASSKKINTSEDFLLAGRSLGKIKTAFSMAATDVGGASIVGAAGYSYIKGMSGSWWNWSTIPAYIILGIFLIRKLKPLAISTVPEFLEKRYDRKSRVLASVMQICAQAAALSTQFVVSAVALSVFTGMNQNIALAISVVIVVAYTIGGGLIAVVNTDVFQFVVIIISVLIMIPLSISHAGGFGGLKGSLPTEFFRFDSLGYWTPISWVLLCFFSYATNQHFLQRVFAAKDVKTASFSYTFTAGTYVFLGLAMSIIGLAGAVILPGIENTNSVYPLLIKEVLPAGLSGIALGGIFAAAMSSADSRLIAITHLFINDLYVPMINKNADDKQILKMSKIVTLIACIVGVGVALISKDLLQIIYVCGIFYSASVFFPLICGLFWKRGNAYGTFAGMAVSIIVGAISQFYLIPHKAAGVLGLPANILASVSGLIIFIVVSLLTSAPGKEKIEFVENLKNTQA